MPVDPQAIETYRQVTGWVQRREAGGIHAIRHRVETYQYAHETCVDRLKELDQPSLFGE